MQIDYDVGDWVVRVAGNPDNAPMGTIRKVASFTHYDFTGSMGVLFTCQSPGAHAWAGENWKKLPKASDEFTEQMRKLKPHKQKVDA